MSLAANFTGSRNTAIGDFAGAAINGAGNIDIGAGVTGLPGEDNTTRIGNGGIASVYINGIAGRAPGPGAVAVMIGTDGKLGTPPSSRRYKEDIQDMAEASSGLLALRAVTFRYQKAYSDGSKPLDYGLIAEEVAEVYPDMVVKGNDGQIETVQYHKLTPMLLNELQKQIRKIHSLEDRLAALEALLSSKSTAAAGR
jgi:hypothetical protein